MVHVPVTRLCVGGPFDGRYYTGHEGQYTLSVNEMQLPKLTRYDPAEKIEAQDIRRKHYRIVESIFCDNPGGKKFSLWIEESLSDADAFERLLNFYKPPKGKGE